MSKGIETIYDIEKLVDTGYIESIIKENAGKKLICFGGGTAASILMKKILYKY